MKNGVEDFVVESTPVLDLKKGGLGQSVPAADANWDSDRTEVYTDSDSSSSVAYLAGENGEHYPITTFPFVMGRGSECDLVLQGKGVSRRHAEIIFQSGRFVVNDLESLNGIKVNGYKVSRVILEENDAIRLGDVALKFQSGASDAKGAKQDGRSQKPKRSLHDNKGKDGADNAIFGPSPYKRVLINASVLFIVVLCGWFGFQYWQGAVQAPGFVGEVDLAGTPQSASPGFAVETPRVSPAPVAPQKSDASTVAEQADVAGVQSEKEGSAPPPSIAPPPSLVAAPKSEDVVSAPVARKPEVGRAEVVTPPKPKVEPARKTVARAPVAAAPDSTGKAQAAMISAEQDYMQGNVERALSSLKPYMNDGSVTAQAKSDLQKLHGTLFSLQTLYMSGQSAYDRGDKEAAFNDWMTFMQKESSAFSGRKSTYSRSISSRVMSEYVALGNEAARAGEHHKAYKMWQKSLEIGENVAARIAIDNANNRAMQLYRQALRLEYVNTSKAKALWQEVVELLPPGTEYNTKAGAKLAWYEKWGT